MPRKYFEIVTDHLGNRLFVSGPLIGEVHETIEGNLLQIVNGKAVSILRKGEWAEFMQDPNLSVGKTEKENENA